MFIRNLIFFFFNVNNKSLNSLLNIVYKCFFRDDDEKEDEMAKDELDDEENSQSSANDNKATCDNKSSDKDKNSPENKPEKVLEASTETPSTQAGSNTVEGRK